MKKIIGAFALASLALGLASADVKFALNYRTQMIGFSRLIQAPAGNADENNNYWFQQIKGWQSASDTVSMSASNDFGGVTVRMDPGFDSDQSPTVNIQQYNGYIKLGAFEIGGGTWKDGRYNGTYQVKNDSDAGWYNGDLFGKIKLGSLYTGAITTSVDDMANFRGGSKASSGYLQWKGDVGDAEVTAELDVIGFYDGVADTWDEEATIYTGFGARINAAFETWQAQFVFKTEHNKTGASMATLGEDRAFALHINPKTLPVTLVAGGSVGFNNGTVTEASVDVRARKVVGPASVTFYTNISHITNDAQYIAAVNHIGAEYLVASTGKSTTADNDFNSSKQNYNTHMWNMLGARVKLNDTFYFLFSCGDIVSLKNVGTDHWTGAEAFVAPGLQIMNGKSGIATYARVGMSHIGVKDYNKGSSENELSLFVPVVIRVRF
ncbi:hypothetical protein [Treponema sp.]|uniref:hypothetical protein n=1 Tax=Treponema sp. TaxID=166 RepID=UPI00388F4344